MSVAAQVEHSMWATWPDRVSDELFRREGDYLGQLGGGMTAQNYWNTVEYIRRDPDLVWYAALDEDDDEFGVVSFDIDGKKITRDLLDSILEINYLHDRLQIDRDARITVLDIGAGYGRFAHRFTRVFPNSFVYCADAVEKSSEICEKYLKYRAVDRARVISMDEAVMMVNHVDLAVNIHSWSECTLHSINTWLRLLMAKHVKNLFLVPHTIHCMSMERDGSAQCFLPWVLNSGFSLIDSRRKFPPNVAGVYPTQYYLFERQGEI